MKLRPLAALAVLLVTQLCAVGFDGASAGAAPNPDGAWLAGESDDSIVRSTHLSFAAPTFVSGSTNFVRVQLEQDDHLFWVSLAAPPGGELTVGTYENASRYPFNGADPGLSVLGDGRGCNRLTGRFEIDELAFDGSGAPTTLVARWEQHCEGRAAASFGALSINGSVPWPNRSISPAEIDFGERAVGSRSASSTVTLSNDGADPVFVQSVALTGRDVSSFELGPHSCSNVTVAPGASCDVPVRSTAASTGELEAALTVRDDASGVTGGDGYDVALTAEGIGIADVFLQGDADASVVRGDHLSFDEATLETSGSLVTIRIDEDDHNFTVSLEAPTGEMLEARAYEGATRWPFNAATEPGLSVSGDGKGCSRVTGRFIIDDIAFGSNDGLARLSARWEHHCEGNVPVVHGAVDFNSDAPYRDRTTSPRVTFRDQYSSSPPVTESIRIDNDGPSPLVVTDVVLDGTDAGRFRVLADGCSDVPVAAAASCLVDVEYRPQAGVTRATTHEAVITIFDDVTPNDGIGAGHRVLVSGTTYPGDEPPVPDPGSDPTPPSRTNEGEFTPLAPVRLLDTREGVGATRAPLGPGGAIDVRIAGRGGVPKSGVAAVVLNATAVGATAPTFITIWPTGLKQPVVSNLNPAVGGIAANMVTVGLGSDGRISAYNLAGRTDLIFDVVGYYTTSSGKSGSRFVGIDPLRLVDTRLPTSGRAARPVGADSVQVLDLDPLFRGGVEGAGVTAIVANVTVTQPTAPSFLTVYPHGGATPLASHLNYGPGDTTPNLVTVRVPSSGLVDFYNLAGTTHLIVDLVGVYTDDFGGDWGRFVPVDPARAYDTRWDALPLAPNEVLSLGGLPGVSATATSVAMNVTVTQPSESGFVTVFPDDACDIPNASNVNFLAGQTVANSALSRLAEEGGCGNGAGWVGFYNPLGSTHVIVDVFGYFT